MRVRFTVESDSGEVVWRNDEINSMDDLKSELDEVEAYLENGSYKVVICPA